MKRGHSKREFDSGATRDGDADKLDYEGFLSPLAMEAFATYMHANRKMADGSLRASDNWQRGIPLSSYMKSGFRHFHEWWKLHRSAGDVKRVELIAALTALQFNVQGYITELMKTPTETIGEDDRLK